VNDSKNTYNGQKSLRAEWLRADYRCEMWFSVPRGLL